jgi:hypothetical protein
MNPLTIDLIERIAFGFTPTKPVVESRQAV